MLEVRGRRDVMSARALVNATGPWVGTFSETVLRRPPPGNVRLIAGSHIVVPRLFEHDRAYIFQAPDGRVVFALPFEGDFTMVGTTDRDFSGDPGKIEPSAEEIGYLCKVASDHFRTAVTPADVVWSFAGVRPLYGEDDAEKPQDTPRDYVLELDRVGRRGAAADGLWRQDHDLSPSRGGGIRQARATSSAHGRTGPRARRCRAATSRSTASSG